MCASAPPTSVVFSWVHTDPLGTPLAVTNTPANPGTTPAAVIWRAKYEPFGKATVNQDPDGDGTTLTLNVRFSGQYADLETGLSYNSKRDYDPVNGRYIESDPIGLPGGMNTYAYAVGDPVDVIDPTGLFGAGLSVNESTEAGLLKFGAGQTGAGGIAAFTDWASLSWGSFGSWGAFGGDHKSGLSYPRCPGKDNWAFGAYAGGGLSAFATDANGISDLAGPFRTYSLNAGWGRRTISIQFSVGTNSAGQQIHVLSYGGPIPLLGLPTGGGFGLDVSVYNTNTWIASATTGSRSGCSCP
jgi:RHS repeat-associated protein